jgi:hypothetical protein
MQIALDNAKANLAQTALTIDAMKQDYSRMLSDAAAQQAQIPLLIVFKHASNGAGDDHTLVVE